MTRIPNLSNARWNFVFPIFRRCQRAPNSSRRAISMQIIFILFNQAEFGILLGGWCSVEFLHFSRPQPPEAVLTSLWKARILLRPGTNSWMSNELLVRCISFGSRFQQNWERLGRQSQRDPARPGAVSPLDLRISITTIHHHPPSSNKPISWFTILIGRFEDSLHMTWLKLSRIGLGGSFGELALLYFAPRAATVQASHS